MYLEAMKVSSCVISLQEYSTVRAAAQLIMRFVNNAFAVLLVVLMIGLFAPGYFQIYNPLPRTDYYYFFNFAFFQEGLSQLVSDLALICPKRQPRPTREKHRIFSQSILHRNWYPTFQKQVLSELLDILRSIKNIDLKVCILDYTLLT